MRKISLTILMISAASFFAKAQENIAFDTVKIKKVNKMMVLSKFAGDSVVLRWVAPNYPLWMAIRKSGVDIYRAELNLTTQTLGEKKKLTASVLKPMTLEAMKKHFKQNDTIAAMIAQILYGGNAASDKNVNNLENLELLEAEQSNRFVYATYLADLYPNVANALALRFVDRSAVKGKSYVYYVKSDVKAGTADALEESITVVNTSIYSKPEKLQTLDALGLDKSVRIFWNRLEGDSKYTAYLIDRKEGSQPFSRRNAQPFVNPDNPNDDKDDDVIVFMDSIPKNYVPYQYRVCGITAFGEMGVWADIVIVGRDLTPPLEPVNVMANSVGGKKVKITWHNRPKENDLAGYVVGRSENYEGPYTPIDDILYNSTDTVAYDLRANSYLRNFYIVSAIDTAGNAARSIPAYVVIADSVPPETPIGLIATIDSLGVVKLHWEMGKEIDLAGYNIYRANSSKEEFSVINSVQVKDNSFMDMVDVNSLTKDVYYKIVAFDNSSNPSKYSSVVGIKKPDYIPPVPPQITAFWTEENSVKLKFMASNSSDLKEYYVYRKLDTVFEKIATLPKSDSMFVDLKLPEKQQVLWYTLVAIDSAGLHSEQAFPQRITLPTKGVQLPNLMLSAKKTSEGITISWDKTIQLPKGTKLMLYKSYGRDELEQYMLLDNLKDDFVDVEFKKEEAINYAVRLQIPSGNMSALSTKIEIKIGK